ncbi:MAG: hypothetical protein AMXMBFR33_01300 [Candidatus Xenobia bacterium]
MRLRYRARFYQEDGWWLVQIPDVGGAGLATQGETLEEARENAVDAVTQVLLSRVDEGAEPDPPTRGRLEAGWEWVYPELRVETAIEIRQMRKAAGLTMASAAGRIGVSLGTYQKWEDPERCNATLETLDKLARAFGRHAEVMFVKT